MPGLIPYISRRNQLIPRNPFTMMDDFFSDAWPFGRSFLSDTFKMDVQESDGAYTIEAEMPGIQKEEIRLSMDDGRLTIGVERNGDVKKDSDSFVHRERHYSSMQRSVYLAEVGDEDIDAALTNGILKISIPKKSKPNRTKEIVIN